MMTFSLFGGLINTIPCFAQILDGMFTASSKPWRNLDDRVSHFDLPIDLLCKVIADCAFFGRCELDLLTRRLAPVWARDARDFSAPNENGKTNETQSPQDGS